ncbi:MAG: trypsin-like serine protease [Candidatus Competibacter sp.]|jgi:hypothetical protein|nr:trypsin-like serine protease [Candidatus Competibacter sp.]
MKRTILAAVVGTTLIAMSGTVEAIIHGYPDNLFHPNVGFIAIESINGPEQKLNLKCSGTLIAPRVFLTAAECTAGLDIVIDPNDGTIRNLYVGFNDTLESDKANQQYNELPLYSVDQVITNPEYSQTHKSDDGNIAVLLLHKDPSISPASLPEEGALDKLRGEGVLNGQIFTAVGYGATQINQGGGPRTFGGFGIRNYAYSDYRALAPGYLYLSMNPATDDGGTCWGDSGGPNFFGYTEMIAALTVKGDAVCRATNVDYRLDTAAAHVFLDRVKDTYSAYFKPSPLP